MSLWLLKSSWSFTKKKELLNTWFIESRRARTYLICHNRSENRDVERRKKMPTTHLNNAFNILFICWPWFWQTHRQQQEKEATSISRPLAAVCTSNYNFDSTPVVLRNDDNWISSVIYLRKLDLRNFFSNFFSAYIFMLRRGASELSSFRQWFQHFWCTNSCGEISRWLMLLSLSGSPHKRGPLERSRMSVTNECKQSMLIFPGTSVYWWLFHFSLFFFFVLRRSWLSIWSRHRDSSRA